MNTGITVVGTILGFIALVVILGLILALPVMWLWNGCFVPAMTGVHEITWLQAWGISILCGILFKDSATSSN
jgi:hypothetical protein